MHAYIRTYVRTYVHAYIHTYVHTFIRTYVHKSICIHSDTQLVDARSRCARTRPRAQARAHTRTLGCIRRMRAYVCTHMHALLRTHTCMTHVPSRARLVRALTTRPPTHRPTRRGRCERGGGGTHISFRLGHSAAAGSAASSVLCASLRAHRAAAPGGSGPPLTRAGRPRAPAKRARGSAAADDRQRPRRRIQRRMVRPSAPARRHHAQQRSAGTADDAPGSGAAGAGRTVFPRACTGRATRGALSPSWSGWTCHAPRARAARGRRATLGGRADERAEATRKETTHCMHTHPHARDSTHTHNGAFGTAMYPEEDAAHAGASLRAHPPQTDAHTRAHPPQPHAHTRVSMPFQVHVSKYRRRWMQRTGGGAADVRERVHLGICTCLDAQASILTHVVQMGIPSLRAHTRTRTHSRTLRAHSYIHIYSYIHTSMYARSDTRLVVANVCRSRRARARTYAHAHPLAWNLHVHTNVCTCTHIYTYPHGDTHVAVARSHCAAARAHTHAHSCTNKRAHTHAEMHSTSTPGRTYTLAYKRR
jgi:hypothetical protein